MVRVIMIKRVLYSFSASKQIVLDFNDLKAGNKKFSKEIEMAYGSKGHGVLMVANVPGIVDLRRRLLPLAHKLANLPIHHLQKYIRPDIFHSLGWSCGVEQFHGKYDITKGSFYSLAMQDTPEEIAPEDLKHFSPAQLAMRQPNKWVDEIPQLEKFTKEMVKTMVSTGTLVARQIDSYANSVLPSPMKLSIEQIVSKGKNHVGRLLHYFPFDKKENIEDDWCGWHNDHSALTSLISSMYVDKDGKELNFTETEGGLFAKNRLSEAAKISIPKDMLAFQLGEVTQILTCGLLEATPHCVVRSEQLAGQQVSRNSYALFMQPNNTQKLSVPNGMDPQIATHKAAHKIPPLQKRWDNGILFAQFNQRTLKEYS